jgi:hypothetical protein
MIDIRERGIVVYNRYYYSSTAHIYETKLTQHNSETMKQNPPNPTGCRVWRWYIIKK